MKKILSLLLCLAMLLSLVACGNGQSAKGGGTKIGYELALITDLGTIDDKSFNQGSWEGMEKYAKENNITYKYYQPQSKETASFVETIDLAIEGGAKLIVLPGYLFEEPVFISQTKHPDIHFILIDGEPHNADYSVYKTEQNTMPVLFKEDQAGFLAGYAAVKDGMKKIGFLGGMAVPAVVRYGYGYIQGADTAAKELNEKIEIKYNYTGSFDATPEAQSLASSWYQNGTEVIFSCGGAVGNSVMAAAEANNKKVIGVDVDQSAESKTVITSALKELSNAVYLSIKDFYDGNFQGGHTTIFRADNNGVGLAMANARFEKFTNEDYTILFEKVKNYEYTINDDVSVTDTSNITPSLKNTEVTYIK